MVIQYADDTQFIQTGDINDIQSLIRRGEESKKKAQLYFYKNGLMLNANDTQCMFVGTRGLLSQIHPDTLCKSIEISCKFLKNLDIHFDNVHINELSRKIYRTIMYVNRLKKISTNTAESP